MTIRPNSELLSRYVNKNFDDSKLEVTREAIQAAQALNRKLVRIGLYNDRNLPIEDIKQSKQFQDYASTLLNGRLCSSVSLAKAPSGVVLKLWLEKPHTLQRIFARSVDLVENKVATEKALPLMKADRYIPTHFPL